MNSNDKSGNAKFSLGLDLGSNSIGYCLTEISSKGVPLRIVTAGTHVFPNGLTAKTNSTKASERRAHRLARRQNRRKSRRIAAVRNAGTKYFGYFPTNKEREAYEVSTDPYEIRTRALYEEISSEELIRALVHLSQRRGYMTTRESMTDESGGAYRKIINATRDEFLNSGYNSYGELLHYKRKSGVNVQTRLKPKLQLEAQATGTVDFDFLVTRDMVEDEFNLIWDTQSQYNPVMTDELKKVFHQIIFYQRKKSVGNVGFCSLEAGEAKAQKAHPVSQYRVILSDINNIRVIDENMKTRELTEEERRTLLNTMLLKPISKPTSKTIPFTVLYKAINLPSGHIFTIDDGKRKGMPLPSTNALMLHKDCFGKLWNTLTLEKQSEVFEMIINPDLDDTPEVIVNYLKTEFPTLTDEQIAKIIGCPLEDGYTSYSKKASNKLIPQLLEGKALWYAEETIYGTRALTSNINKLSELPYYAMVIPTRCTGGSFNEEISPKDTDPEGFYGKISNPVVHASLNQIRKIVNKIISKHGVPDRIVVELAREVKSPSKANYFSKMNDDNRKNNERISKILSDFLGEVKITTNNIIRYKLWEELPQNQRGERICVYSGKEMSLGQALDGRQTNIDHIQPRSRSFNDNLSNKILCFQSVNAEKADKTPDEAWSMDEPRWKNILERAKHLPHHKFELFTVGVFDEQKNGNLSNDGFMPHHLKDTQYIAVATREYLSCLFDKGIHQVETIHGHTTNSMRNQFPADAFKMLPKKDRDDHRHHFVDAAMVSIVSNKTLESIFKRNRNETMDNALVKFAEEISNFYNNMVVTHKREKIEVKNPNSTGTYLHRETYYGHTGESVNGKTIVTSRKSILSLTQDDIESIRHEPLKQALQDAVKDCVHSSNNKDWQKALYNFAVNSHNTPFSGIKKVKTYTSKLSVVEIKPKTYVRPDGNFSIVFWKNPDNTVTSNIISNFDAYGKNPSIERHPAAKKLFEFQKGDMVRVIKQNVEDVMIVRGFSGDKMKVALHTAGGKAKQMKTVNISSTQIQKGEVIMLKY